MLQYGAHFKSEMKGPHGNICCDFMSCLVEVNRARVPVHS